MIGGLRALAAGAAAGSLAACLHSDPCASGATCVNLEIKSYQIESIDQLELDVVYDGYHSTTTIGTVGDPIGTVGDSIGLSITIPLTLDVPGSGLIDVSLIAAGKLGGSVLGVGGGTATVQHGFQASTLVFMEPLFTPCVEGELYCSLSLEILGGDPKALYRCTGGVPIFSMRCSSGCNPYEGSHGQCVGSAQ